LKKLRDKIGVVPQKAVLFKGSIRENMRWGNKNATDEESWKPLILPRQEKLWLKRRKGLIFLLNKEEKTFREGSVNVLP